MGDGVSSSTLPHDEYRVQKRILQQRIASAVDGLGPNRAILLFEGRDTAGKSSTIRKSMADIASSRVTQEHFPAPQYAAEAKARRSLDYYKQFFPRPGTVLFLDRSWYGLVMGLRTYSPMAMDWKQEYKAINTFEGEILDDGIALYKCYLDLSRPEMKRRVNLRREGKGTGEFKEADARALLNYDRYTKVDNEAIEATSTPTTPWHRQDMDDKWRGRLHIMERLATFLEALGDK